MLLSVLDPLTEAALVAYIRRAATLVRLRITVTLPATTAQDLARGQLWQGGSRKRGHEHGLFLIRPGRLTCFPREGHEADSHKN